MRPLFQQRNQVLIFDFSNLVARIATTGVENDSQFMQLFAQSLVRYRKRFPDHLWVFALEGTGRDSRRELFPGYKKNVRMAAGALAAYRPVALRLLKTLSCTILQPGDGEADDAIATWISQQDPGDSQITIVTEDHDLWQLIQDPWVEVQSKRLGKITTAEVIKFLKGIPPHKIRLWKALAGDTSDNIPKIKGLSTKAIKSLVLSYSSTKDILRALRRGEISGKEAGILQNSKPQMVLNYKLVKLRKRVKLEELVYPGSSKKAKKVLEKYSVWALTEEELKSLTARRTL